MALLWFLKTCYKFPGAPTLFQGYPIAVQVPPHTLQFSWDGPLDDFIDYYMVTIQNGTDVLTFNTTGLQANLTSTCGVIYECSVVPVNVVGQGNMSSSHHDTPCSSEGTCDITSRLLGPIRRCYNPAQRIQDNIINTDISYNNTF